MWGEFFIVSRILTNLFIRSMKMFATPRQTKCMTPGNDITTVRPKINGRLRNHTPMSVLVNSYIEWNLNTVFSRNMLLMGSYLEV